MKVKKFNVYGLTCEDSKDLDKSEIVAAMMDYLQSLVMESDRIAQEEMSDKDRFTHQDRLETRFAEISNCLANTLGIDVRSPDGIRVTSDMFGRIFYNRQQAEIACMK